MTDVKLKRGKQAKIDETPIEDGSLSFATDTRKILLDTKDGRIQFAGVGMEVSDENNNFGEVFNDYAGNIVNMGGVGKHQ